MLHEFLQSNREELISRCRLKVATRSSPKLTEKEIEHGIPTFLTQITEILRMESLGQNIDNSVAPEASEAATGVEHTAIRHGEELLLGGFTVDQVVHDYGDLCQAVTELAIERNAEVTNQEFRTFNRCLDNAIAGAVSEFSRQRSLSSEAAPVVYGGVVFFAHELDLLTTATLAVDALKRGHVGMGGSTGALLERTLKELVRLTTAALSDVRATANQ